MSESNLKISNIQSIKQEPEEEDIEQQQANTIKVRSLAQLQTIQPQSILAKKSNPVQSTKQHYVLKRLNNSRLTLSSQSSSSPSAPASLKIQKTNPSQVISSTLKLPPAVESYIKSLEEQNKEMKKLLISARRETVDIQLRLHKVTNQINLILAKGNVTRPMLSSKAPQNAQHMSSSQTTQPLPQQSISISQGGQVTIRNTKSSIHTARVPIFPITKVPILEQLESDLSKREISEYVFKKLFILNDKAGVDKPTILLTNVLESMIDPQLLSQYHWAPQENEIVGINAIDINFFAKLQRVRIFFAKLVNSLANKIFSKPIDKRAIEAFIRIQIKQYREFIEKSKLKEVTKINNFQIKSEIEDPLTTNGNSSSAMYIDNEDQLMG